VTQECSGGQGRIGRARGQRQQTVWRIALPRGNPTGGHVAIARAPLLCPFRRNQPSWHIMAVHHRQAVPFRQDQTIAPFAMQP